MKIFICRNRLAFACLLCSILSASALLTGCGSNAPPTDNKVGNATAIAPVAARAPALHFTDVTERAGIKFQHNNGAFGAALLPETMGNGGAWFDFDNDGDADIFLVNGRNWTQDEFLSYNKSPVSQDEMQFLVARARREGNNTVRRSPPNKPAQRTVGHLYRNNGDGTFSDVSKNSGLDIEMLGMGAAAGDYDGDGKIDLCVTSYGRIYLFRNLGQGRFREEAERAGMRDDAWSTSAAWFDYDRDGRLDLFVCRYLKWTPATDTFVTLDQRYKSYGWPKTYPSQTSRLFHNLGGGRFEDVSARAGISRRLKAQGKNPAGSAIMGAALGVVVCDPNDDGWPDLIVANDLRANFYFVNQKNGTFEESAAKSGIAVGKKNKPRGGMGIDSADVDHSGRDSVAIGHFNADIMGLWQDSGGGTFNDIADDTAIGPASATFLTFGLLFADFNNDGWPELLAANGHVDPTVHNYLGGVTYLERPLLFLNQGAQTLPGAPDRLRFREIGQSAGLTRELVARGLAVADYDLDGDLDILLTTNGGPPHLYRNELYRNDSGNKSAEKKRVVRLVLRGQSPNVDAIGAHIEAHAGGEILHRDVRTGSSYLSQNELPLTLGLGRAETISLLKVRWPNGQSAQFKAIKADQIVTIEQGKGLVKQAPLP